MKSRTADNTDFLQSMEGLRHLIQVVVRLTGKDPLAMADRLEKVYGKCIEGPMTEDSLKMRIAQVMGFLIEEMKELSETPKLTKPTNEAPLSAARSRPSFN